MRAGRCLENAAWTAVFLAAGCAGNPAPAPAEVGETTGAIEPVAATDAGEFEIQARTGAQGGNPSFVAAGGVEPLRRVDARSDAPLDFSKPPTMNERATAFVRGGPIPAGSAFVVEGIDVYASAAGDSNGHGEVVVHVGETTILRLRDVATAGRQWFAGRAAVQAGRERDLSVELANSSAVDVRFHGRFVGPDDAPAAIEFAPGDAPSSAARSGPETAELRGFYLVAPAARLQVRAGAGGGNPNRIDLVGGKSAHVRRVSPTPLAVGAPPQPREACVAYVEGGLVPPGREFVVTRVEYDGWAKGDSNGRGSVRIEVNGVKLVAVRNVAEPVHGTWTGRVAVAPGEEKSVFVEVADSSAADVRISGEFVDAPAGAR